MIQDYKNYDSVHLVKGEGRGGRGGGGMGGNLWEQKRSRKKCVWKMERKNIGRIDLILYVIVSLSASNIKQFCKKRFVFCQRLHKSIKRCWINLMQNSGFLNNFGRFKVYIEINLNDYLHNLSVYFGSA